MQLLYFMICNSEFILPNAITKTEKEDYFFALANYYCIIMQLILYKI